MQGGLWPGVVLFFSMMYKREEIALRLGMIYGFSPLSGACSGLLTSALYNIGDRAGLAAWRWVLIVEGIASCIIGLGAYFVLPETLEKATFLTEYERKIAVERTSHSLPVGVTEQAHIGSNPRDSTFKWSSVIRATTNPRT